MLSVYGEEDDDDDDDEEEGLEKKGFVVFRVLRRVKTRDPKRTKQQKNDSKRVSEREREIEEEEEEEERENNAKDDDEILCLFVFVFIFLETYYECD